MGARNGLAFVGKTFYLTMKKSRCKSVIFCFISYLPALFKLKRTRIELIIRAFLLQELFVRAAFDNLAVI